MNNKKLGTEFEKWCVKELAKIGCWVHFIQPNEVGAQPFDIIAVMDKLAYAIDCKTSEKPVFSLSRLEENQMLAFEQWQKKTGFRAGVWVKYHDKVYMVSYDKLKEKGKVNLREEPQWISTLETI